jgi:hypothetical protein
MNRGVEKTNTLEKRKRNVLLNPTDCDTLSETIRRYNQMNMLDNFNKAWERDNDIVTLTPSPNCFSRKALEGKTLKDKSLMTKAIGTCVIGTEVQYNNLLKMLSQWGYAVEIPMDFAFSS